MTLSSDHFLQSRYRLEDLLGQGGMGAVYRAVDLTFNTPVAIKENLATGAEAQKQFAHEASLLHKLRHPNIPRVTDYFFIPNRGQYLVMDYVEGENLAQILDREGHIDEDRAVGWALQVLDALCYLHAQDVIHRDVKPANVKIAPEGRVYLVDFGLAKVYDPSQRTTPGARAVTPGFAPPEQYGEGRTDARSDIYSAGATLYAMVTGEILPDALTLLLGSQQLTTPRTVNPRLSPRVELAILKAMQVRPADRFQTAGAFSRALLAAKPGLARAGLLHSTPLDAGAAACTPADAPSPGDAPPPGVAPPPGDALAYAVDLAYDAPPAPEPAREPFEPELVPIPAGTFLMGSDPRTDSRSAKVERPQHSLFLPAYAIARTPVTNVQYAAFVTATGHSVPDRREWRDGEPPPGKPDHPVVNVTWHDAVAYCRWLAEVTGRAYRLPSEAEWEKAARGSLGRVYPWGDAWDAALCNTGESERGDTTPVDAFPQGASPYGLLDMAGNVYEWTLSLWSKPGGSAPRLGYAAAPASTRAVYGYPYRQSDGRENVEADDQTPRVVRGGSFIRLRHDARCANRDFSLPNAKYVSHGFRVVVQKS